MAKARSNRNEDGKPVETGESHQRFRSTSTADPGAARALAIDAARMLSDDKCEDVVVLDVSTLSQLSDYIVIGSGTSDRQMASSADDVEEMAQKPPHNSPLYRRSKDDRATWVVLDFVDVVVHVFEPNTRAHYDLEMMWEDAPHVAWERPGKDKRDRAGVT